MIDTLTWIVFWFAGVLLGTQMVAAALSPVDLWYRLHASRFAIAGRIIGWFGASLILYLMLPDAGQSGFLGGVQLVVVVFVVVRIGPFLMRMNTARKHRQRYKDYLATLD